MPNPYSDPLASLNMAPTAAQLEYRESVPDRWSNFASGMAPVVKAAAKGVAGAFGDSFVGDSYKDDNPNPNYGVDYSGSEPDYANLKRLLEEVKGTATDNNPSPSFSGSGKVQAKPITYSDWSDAAKYFGMDQATAYAEHMANTAHQREVADLRAAGLNPVLGLGSGASGVSGHSATSGGGSGSSARKTDSGSLIDTIGATVGFLASVMFGSTAGNHASKAVSGLGKLFGK